MTEAKNPEAARAFIDFLGTPEGLKIYQQITGNFLGVEGVDFEINPVMEAIRPYAESGKFGFPPIVWTNGSTLAPMLTKGMHEIILGSKTPEQLIAQICAFANEVAEIAGTDVLRRFNLDFGAAPDHFINGLTNRGDTLHGFTSRHLQLSVRSI